MPSEVLRVLFRHVMHLSRRQPLHKKCLNLTQEQEQGGKSKKYSSANAGR